MRQDMRRVIINRPRYKGFGNRKGRLRGIDPELLPEREGMRIPYGFARKEHHDRTSPLYRFLRSNVGRPWNKVWSEICSHADSRTLDGTHLRQHARAIVDVDDPVPVYSGLRPFYVEDGILKHQKSVERWKWRMKAPEPEIEQTERGGIPYVKRQGVWYKQRVVWREVLMPLLEGGYRTWKEPREYLTQVSRKDILQLKLP